MNLDIVHEILVATTAQPHGFLKIADPKLEPEVREMAKAGLITATLKNGKRGSVTAVNSVTDSGRQFLRVFHRHDFSHPDGEVTAPRVLVPMVKPVAGR